MRSLNPDRRNTYLRHFVSGSPAIRGGRSGGWVGGSRVSSRPAAVPFGVVLRHVASIGSRRRGGVHDQANGGRQPAPPVTRGVGGRAPSRPRRRDGFSRSVDYPAADATQCQPELRPAQSSTSTHTPRPSHQPVPRPQTQSSTSPRPPDLVINQCPDHQIQSSTSAQTPRPSYQPVPRTPDPVINQCPDPQTQSSTSAQTTRPSHQPVPRPPDPVTNQCQTGASGAMYSRCKAIRLVIMHFSTSLGV